MFIPPRLFRPAGTKLVCKYCSKKCYAEFRHNNSKVKTIQCPVCGEWILAEAKKCKHCGTWLNKFTKEKYEETTNTAKTTDEEDDPEGVRDAGCVLQIESVLVAVLASFYMGWVGVVVCLLILQLLLHIHTFRVWYCIIVSILWGIVGFSFGGVLGGVIGLGVSLLFHYPAMKKGFDVD